MISDSERRAIAARLRAQQAAQFPPPEVAYDVSPSLTTWEGLGRIVLDPEAWAECDRLKSRDNRAQAVRSAIAGRLADLIDPGSGHEGNVSGIDRDALLELADEMGVVRSRCDFCVKKGECDWADETICLESRIDDYARRIRVLLGADR